MKNNVSVLAEITDRKQLGDFAASLTSEVDFCPCSSEFLGEFVHICRSADHEYLSA
eukprot:CAMPEP_0184646390 /NCGR_PEP_ID=MMETSP0308-20130426/3093_1 /TAXON_ID=38269 /ORGANISM="Gloeochaete witrockiana, Strain SAG 46.84" /LENGTH=55 /DNA_ID=CAMNT_0027076373 /DNA_START=1043 /DNA_END=1206 /DNA_ORIENTATION=+